MLQNLCTPALIYLIFSVTQIIIDIFKRDFNVALVKFCVAFIFTILLNYLCQSGLGIVSWVIVFIPFILMSIIATYILTFFGIDPRTNKVRILQNGEVLVDESEEAERERSQIDNSSPSLTELTASYVEVANKIEVSYTSNKAGKVWCKAVIHGSQPPPISEIKNIIKSSDMVEGENTCEIKDYDTKKTYDIYVYSEDLNGNVNDQSDVKKISGTVSTGDTFTLISESIGFMNTKSGFSNYYQNNSKLYKKRQQHIKKIYNILVQLNEHDTSAYFQLQSTTCANKKTNAEYERCMKRVIQEAYSKIRCDFNKKEFLRMLENQNINTKGITSQLI
jgi:hypothetical protein